MDACKILLCLIVACVGMKAHSETPAFDLSTRTPESVLLGPLTGYFEDSQREFELKDLSEKNSFTYNSAPLKNFSYTHSRIWTRLLVGNSSQQIIKGIVEVEIPGVKTLRFYRVTDFGIHLVDQERAISYRNPVFKVSLDPGAKEVWFMAFENDYAMAIKPTYYSPEAFNRKIEAETIVFSSYAGFVVFAIAFSLFLHGQTRHRPFLFYSLTILSFHFLFFLTNFGVLDQLWENWLWLRTRAIFLFIECSLFFGFHFFISLSEFKKYLTRLYPMTLIFPAKSLLIVAISFFYFDPILVSITVASTAVQMLFFIAFGTLLSVRGQRSAFYFVIGWGVAFVCNTIYALAASIHFPALPPMLMTFFGHDLLLVANLIEIVFMALAIGDQFVQYRSKARHENENLIRLQKDLDDAEAVQAAFFHQRSIPPSLSLWADSRSAGTTGGDWYGYFHDAASNRFYLSIVDVTGHGVRSALVTGAMHGTFYSLVPLLRHQGNDPEKRLQCLAQSLNQIVHDTGKESDLMATMVLVEIDLATLTLSYMNMAHCPSILINQQKASLLHIPGSPLGLHKQVRYKVKTFAMKGADILILYTDGWLENHAPGARPLSIRRFMKSLEPVRNLDELKSKFDAIQAFGASMEAEDDYTAIAIQLHRSA